MKKKTDEMKIKRKSKKVKPTLRTDPERDPKE